MQSGKAPPPGEFQVVLFQALDLDPDREHIVQVTNLPSETDRPSEHVEHLEVDVNADQQTMGPVIYGSTSISSLSLRHYRRGSRRPCVPPGAMLIR